MRLCIRTSQQRRCVRVVYDTSVSSASNPSPQWQSPQRPQVRPTHLQFFGTIQTLPGSSHCRSWESISDGVHCRSGSWCIAVPLGRRHLEGFIWAEGIQIHSSCVRHFFEPVPPTCVNAMIWYHLGKSLETNESIVRRLLCSMYMYVNEIIAGGRTEEKVFKLYAQSKEIFRKGDSTWENSWLIQNVYRSESTSRKACRPTIHPSRTKQRIQRLPLESLNLQEGRSTKYWEFHGIPTQINSSLMPLLSLKPPATST